MDPISLIDDRIDELRTELAELETARNVYNRLASKHQSNGHPAKSESASAPEIPPQHERTYDGEFAGNTISECAETILKRANRVMHYRDVAAEATAAGYRSSRSADSQSTAMSFLTMMRRSPLFETTGKGLFRLAQSTTTDQHE